MGVTQPAVTRIIHDIEHFLGTELIIRSSSGVKLTEAAKRLVPHSRTILRDINTAISDIRCFQGHSSGEVTFGFSSLIGFTILPELVVAFNKKYPAIQLSIKEAQLSELLPALREGQIDFVIGTVNSDIPVQNMVVYPFFNAEFAFIAHRQHPLAHCESLQALSHARWVLPQTDMGYYYDLYSLFEHDIVNTGSIVRTDSVITILSPMPDLLAYWHGPCQCRSIIIVLLNYLSEACYPQHIMRCFIRKIKKRVVKQRLLLMR